MVASLKASKQGLEIVDRRRRLKGWKKTEKAWCELADVSKDTLNRFWRSISVRQENFVNICEVVGVENWQEIVDFSKETEVEPTSKPKWSLELKATVDETDKPLIENLITFSKERLGYPSVTWQSIAPGSEGLIEGWQPVESVMPRGRSRSRTTEKQLPESSERGGQEIELGTTKVVLVVEKIPLSEKETGVSIEIYPGAEANYLPPGLEVAIIDETDAIIVTERVGTNKDSLQIELGIEPEELLSVRLALGEVSITEYL